jgi:membrane fusion protein, multidrug efflux system
MIFKNLGSAAIFLAGLAFVNGCKEEKEEKTSPDPIRVNVVQLNPGGYQNGSESGGIQYSGTIQAKQTIDLAFQVGGTITSLPVQTGQYVSKGQLIAAVDESVYRAQYNVQLAQVKLARENYNRISEVFKKGSIAEIRLIEARSQYEQASSAAKATYQNLAHTRLYAPRSGYVGAKRVEAGAMASPGMPVVQLLDISSVDVLVSVPEGEINRYRKGDRATVFVDALNNRSLEGLISEIGVLALQGSASYNVKVSLANPNKQLKPGMLCRVTFQPRATNNTTAFNNEIVVPAQAVQVDERGKNFVYVADTAADIALRKEVVTGAIYNNGLAIRQGLTGNERIITNGFQKLTDRSPIQIIK